jgi:hypothetical protein
VTTPRITEAEFLGQVLALTRLCGWRTAHFRPARTVAGWRTAVAGDGRGFPDLLLLRGERIIAAELKVPPNKLAAEQEEWLAAFRAAGVPAFVWVPTDWAAIEAELQGEAAELSRLTGRRA